MKKILVISHERSGTHLLINSIAFNTKQYNTGYEEIHGVDPDVILAKIKEDSKAKILKSHHTLDVLDPILEEILEHCIVFYISREGKDTLASCYNHYVKYYETDYNSFDEFLRGKHAPKFITDNYMLPGQEYANMPDKWSQHVEKWTKRAAEKFGWIYHLTYEQLLYDFSTCLDLICNALGETRPEIPRKPGLHDLAVQPRIGRSGDWVNFFNQDDLDFFNEQTKDLHSIQHKEVPKKTIHKVVDIRQTRNIQNGTGCVIICDASVVLEEKAIRFDEPLPFEDASVEMFKVYDVFQFLDGTFPAFMLELHRCLIQGGILSVRVPAYPCAASISNPYTKRVFTPFTFNYFTHLFETLTVEEIEQARGQSDRGMVGSYETYLYIEMTKPDPMRERFIKKHVEAVKGMDIKDIQFVGLKNVNSAI
jgi:sulfotransferase family protein